MIKISILIAVYQAENYIEDCLKSVLSQTYQNIEVILVNDGSTDRSDEICRSYADRDNRIHYFDCEHRGAASAKNEALMHINGDFFMFVDSDDTAETDMVERAVDSIGDKTDMVVFGMKHIYEDGSIENVNFREGKWNLSENREDFLINEFLNYRVGWELWNRIYRTGIYTDNNLEIDEEMLFYDDFLFTFKYLLYCREVISIGSENLYNYYKREGSLTEKWRDEDTSKYYERLGKVLDKMVYECAICKDNSVKANIDFIIFICLEWHSRDIIKRVGYKKNREIVDAVMPRTIKEIIGLFENEYSYFLNRYGKSAGVTSVIIPIYNVEKYLNDCIMSVIEQTCQKMQIILVDDGSTDNSGELCDKAREEDYRIQVIHKENGGLSSARNAGIEAAMGQYIQFVDGDDYIDKKLIETASMAMEKSDSEVCIFKASKVTEQGEEPFGFIYEYGVIEYQDEKSRYDFIVSHLLKYEYGWEAWSRMYSADLIKRNRIRFVSEREIFAEDMLFSLCTASCTKRAIMLTDRLYYYIERSGSLMDQKNKRMQFAEFAGLCEEYYRFLENQNIEKLTRDNFYIIYYIIMKRHFDWMVYLYKMRSVTKNMNRASHSLFAKRQIGNIVRHWDEIWSEQVDAGLRSPSKVQKAVDKNLLVSMIFGGRPLYYGTRILGKIYCKVRKREMVR